MDPSSPSPPQAREALPSEGSSPRSRKCDPESAPEASEKCPEDSKESRKGPTADTRLSNAPLPHRRTFSFSFGIGKLTSLEKHYIILNVYGV